jgi:hypothetical protein
VPKPTGIFWLASYPKSGNTWFRVFLAHLLSETNKPLNLDEISTGAIASSRQWIDQALGFDSAHLMTDELDALRPAIYEWHAAQASSPTYHKIHDAYTYLQNHSPMIPTKGCLGALYFIRNPLDVAVSFANHANCSIDESIQSMGNPDFSFCKGLFKQHNQLRQQLQTWSMHVRSWASISQIPCLVLRYEDMKQAPLETFTQAVKFLQLDASQSRIEDALTNARIERLQELEQTSGFAERPPKIKQFFRKGIVDDWKNTLNQDQINQIIHDHGEVMKIYGYL